MLYLNQSRIQGVVGGRSVFCSFRSFPGDLKLPPGEYQLIPGGSSPVYGPVLGLVPIGPGGWAPNQHKKAPPPNLKKWAPPSSEFKVQPPSEFKVQPPSTSGIMPGGKSSAQGKVTTPADAQPAVLPVVGRPVAGGMCLVVDQGFSDLLDSVRSTGAVKILIGL